MNILLAEDEEGKKRINIDDLYEKNYRRDMKRISIFNKIVNRIHKRMITTSRMKRDHSIWFIVPEFLFGEPNYDKAECIAYVVKQLTENGFSVRYIHPQTLFISWENWVPSYVRNKIKKETGFIVNEKGEIVQQNENDETTENQLLNLGNSKSAITLANGKEYTPIEQYKPSGTFVYNESLFRSIDAKKDMIHRT